MSKELLTASRMATLLACPRRHYIRYEAGIKKAESGMALRIGSAIHRGLDARWRGAEFEGALGAAIGGESFEDVILQTVWGLLGGYYARYGEAKDDPDFREVRAEQEFCHPIDGSRTFDSAGKIDGIGVLNDGGLGKIETKTCGEDISPDSDYWLRLRLNQQVFQYVDAARRNGWDLTRILYDVIRKPAIKPLESIPVLDDQGRKVVHDANGERVMKKNGEPRESGDTEKGYVLQTRAETMEEYGERLYKDTQERPEFYFQRREVPVLDQDLEEFRVQRLELSRSILGYRRAERKLAYREQAWPRNVNGMTCRMCEYQSFCLQGHRVDPASPPSGFVVGEKNEELSAAKEIA